MTTTSSSTASLYAGTVATGTGVLDVPTLVNALMTTEQVPLTNLNNKISGVNTQISALGSFVSGVQSFQASLDALASPASFSTRSVSSNSAVVSATATSAAAVGTTDILVQQTAQGQRTLLSGFGSATAAAGTGTFTLTPVGGSAVSVATTATTTLQDLATSINNANAGVTASVVQQSTGSYSLLLASDATGAAAGFSTSFVDANNTSLGTLNDVQQARDAKVQVNGVTYTRSSNSISDIVTGVTLSLDQPVDPAATPVSARLAITAPTSGAVQAVQNMVSAYNSLVSLYGSLTQSSTDSTTRGPLNSDQGLSVFMGQLRSMFIAGVGDGKGDHVQWAQAGVTLQNDGTLTVDSTQLQTAAAGNLGTLLATGATFGAPGVTTSTDLRSFVTNAVITGGMLATEQDSAKTTLTDLNTQVTQLNDQLALKKARYTAQYAALDASLTQMNTVSQNLAIALSSLSATGH